MATPHIYRLARPDLPWGDYGDVLAHGEAKLSSDESTLELQRTGPFVPPLSQPTLGCYVVVTDRLLNAMKAAKLTGFTVMPVSLVKTPLIDWRKWSPYGDAEMKYPAGGEPENYLLRRKHSPEASAAIGTLWYLKFQPGIHFAYDGGPHVVASTWNGNDFFSQHERPLYNYVSQRARDWLLQNVGEWVAFKEESAW